MFSSYIGLCFYLILSPSIYSAEEPSEPLPKKPCLESVKDIKVANLCIDAIFKHGLHESEIMINLLNTLLNLRDKDEIITIDYLDKDLPSDNPLSALGYNFTVDLRCRSQDGRYFLVEMQNDFRDDYHMKALIEHSRTIAQTDISEPSALKETRKEENKKDADKFWKSINGIYTLVFTNKNFKPSQKKEIFKDECLMEPDLINPYELRHIHRTDRRFGDVPSQIILVMLHNLKKKEEELDNDIERWCYLFKDPTLSSGVKKIEETKIIHDPARVAGTNKYIAQLIERIKMDKIPLEVKSLYIERLRYYNGAIADIERKAESRGREEGKMEGKIEGKLEIIQALLKNGMPLEQVSTMTQISQAEISDWLAKS